MAENLQNIGARILDRLNFLKMKQKNLSEQTGITTTAISNYINGNRTPDSVCLYKLSVALNTTMEWLLMGTENSTNENISAELSSSEQELIDVYRTLDKRDQCEITGIAKMKANRALSGNKLASSISGSGDTSATNERVG